jgi:tetratricopeptide (TPR) repeat protein
MMQLLAAGLALSCWCCALWPPVAKAESRLTEVSAITQGQSTSAGSSGSGSLADADRDYQKAIQLWGDGRSVQAEALLNQALTILQAQIGPSDPRVAQVLERLGALSYNRGNYAEAEQRFRKALDIDTKALGERNIATAYLMGDLGAAIREQYRYGEAQAMVEHSLALRRELVPANDPLIAGGLNNLARVYLAERRYDDARRALDESLDIYVARSVDAGIRDDRALLERIDNAERNVHELAHWGLVLAAAALGSLAILLACNLWSERRHIATAVNRPMAVRLLGIAATLGLFGSVGILCAVSTDWLMLSAIPWLARDRYTLQNSGKLGFLVGIWISAILLQIFSNIARRAVGLPTHPIVYFHWSAVQPRLSRRDDGSAAKRPVPEGLPGSVPWFAAMEYHALMLNRTYKVFVTDHMLCGANIRGMIASPLRVSQQMFDQTYWTQTQSARIYERVDVTSETFRQINSANFQIGWGEISEIDYLAGRKWGMGNVPHSGRLVFHLRSGKSRELILLGEQNGEALREELMQKQRAEPAPGIA